MREIMSIITNKNLKIEKLKKWLFYILAIIFLAALIFECFLKLNIEKINDWDEARHGINAYEMYMSKNLIVTTYRYKIDYWNLKPPLSEYFICIGYKLFGFNSIGLRFYSALSMFMCAIVTAYFARKQLGRIAYLSVLLGYTSIVHLYTFHCARAGDADSIYILFYALSILFLLSMKRSIKFLYLACLCFSFAFLAKSWHAGCIAALIILYVIFSGKIVKLKIKQIIACILCAIVPILIWVLIRFQYDGMEFFKQMVEYDLLKRTSSAIENHAQRFEYYFILIGRQAEFLGLVIPIIIYIIANKFFIKDKDNKEKMLVILLSICIPMVMFTCAKTKLDWYVYCIYPPLILAFGYAMQYLYQEFIKNKKHRYLFIFICIPATLIGLGTSKNINNIINLQKDNTFYSDLIVMLDRNEEYSNCHVYKYVNPQSENWSQSEILVAELYGNILPLDGSIESWKNDNNSYLIVRDEFINDIEYEYKVIYKNQGYLILKH